MSGRVTDRVVEEIRARTDIVALISSRGVTLKRAGASFKGCCPFHREKTPSFHVNPLRQFYHCFGCQEHGDVFTFLMKQDGLTFMEAVKNLAEKCGVTIETGVDYESEKRNRQYALHGELAAFYQRCLKKTKEATAARDYLLARRLSADDIERFGIGYAPEMRNAVMRWADKNGFTVEELVSAGILLPPRDERQADYFDRFKGRIMFPINDVQGRVVAFSGRILNPAAHPAKYVNSPETLVFRKSKVLYGLDKARSALVRHPRREAIICEGQIDVIRCHAAGITTAVASQGTAFTNDHIELLKRYADTVVILFDSDSAGRTAAIRTGALFLEAGIPVRVATMPAGEDPDSLICKQGAEAVRALTENATSIVAFQIATLRANEARPDDIDAFHRISRDVVHTLGACKNEILRLHLLQEAAQLLKIPEATLQNEVVIFLKNKPAPAPRSPATTTTTLTDDDGAPLHDPFAHEQADSDSLPDDLVLANVTTSATAKKAAPPLPLPSAEKALVELLLEYEHESATVTLLKHYLNTAILQHPHVHRLFAAWLNDGDSSDILAAVYETGDDEYRRFFDAIVVQSRPLAQTEEITPLATAQDLVCRVWIDFMRQRRETCKEDILRRLTLTQRIKELQDAPRQAERQTPDLGSAAIAAWNIREPIIAAELAILKDDLRN